MATLGSFILQIILMVLPNVLFFFVVTKGVLERKGRYSTESIVLSLVPICSIFYITYVLSLTDKDVLDRLAALEGKAKTP